MQGSTGTSTEPGSISTTPTRQSRKSISLCLPLVVKKEAHPGRGSGGIVPRSLPDPLIPSAGGPAANSAFPGESGESTGDRLSAGISGFVIDCGANGCNLECARTGPDYAASKELNELP